MKKLKVEFIDWIKQISIRDSTCEDAHNIYEDAYNIIVNLKCQDQLSILVEQTSFPTIAELLEALKNDCNNNGHMTNHEKDMLNTELDLVSDYLYNFYPDDQLLPIGEI